MKSKKVSSSDVSNAYKLMLLARTEENLTTIETLLKRSEFTFRHLGNTTAADQISVYETGIHTQRLLVEKEIDRIQNEKH